MPNPLSHRPATEQAFYRLTSNPIQQQRLGVLSKSARRKAEDILLASVMAELACSTDEIDVLVSRWNAAGFKVDRTFLGQGTWVVYVHDPIPQQED